MTAILTAFATSLIGILLYIAIFALCEYLDVPIDACYHALSVEDWLNQLPW